MRKKSSYFRTSSSLNMAVRGIDSLRSPCGQPTHCVRGRPTGCASCRTPVGLLTPLECIMRKKARTFVRALLKYGGEGDRLASLALRAAHSLRSWSVQLAAPVVEPRSGFSPPGVHYAKKSSHFRTSSSLNMAVRGIRTPDTLPYTHFPGVLLQPLGHLTKLFCRLTSWGQRGATIGSWSKTVKKNFNDNYCLLIL